RPDTGAYLTAIADSASRGGRWIVSLDDRLAGGIAARQPQTMDAWKRITAAAGFFAAHKEWAAYSPAAVTGVISDFSGKNEFFGRELLNLLDRAGQHYRILLKDRAIFDSLRAVIYADVEPP